MSKAAMNPQQILLEMYKEYRTELRHQETQRSTVSGICVALAAGLIGLALQEKLNLPKPYLGLLLINFSFASILMLEKLYERFILARARTHIYLEEIDAFLKASLNAEIPVQIQSLSLQDIWVESDWENTVRHPILSRIRLHHLWDALLVGAGLCGINFCFSGHKLDVSWWKPVAGPAAQIVMLAFVTWFDHWNCRRMDSKVERMKKDMKSSFPSRMHASPHRAVSLSNSVMNQAKPGDVNDSDLQADTLRER